MTEVTDSPFPRRRTSVVRATAATLATALAFAAVAPPSASAVEAESEGEGSAVPGAVLPGLEEGVEPGGEETALGEVAIGQGEEEAEEAAPVEVEGTPPPEAGEASPPVEPAAPPPDTEEAPPAEQPPSPATTGPVYEAEVAAPSYETASPAPPVEAVRNEAIVASPEGPGRKAPPEVSARKAQAAPGPVAATPEPEPVESPPDPPMARSPSAVPTTADRAGSLSGQKEHAVAPGECLWSIAEAVLPAGASEARIAAEVARLWRLNATRIGTGDPNLILVGTALRLR
jgi:hypothetical protein